jgi:hypothetical protein
MTRIFLPALFLFWSGLLFGVAFLATPIKFAAPSLSLPVAVDVGRQTFGMLNQFELGLSALLLGLLWRGARALPVRLGGLAVIAIVAVETFWLLPRLDQRAEIVIAGGEPAPSRLHQVYIGLDAVELVLLLTLGLATLYALSRPSTETTKK